VNTDVSAALKMLRSIVGKENVLVSEQDRAFFSEDVFFKGLTPEAVIIPESRQDLSAAVSKATDAGLAVIPRGGGLSYTRGYLPISNEAVIVDTRRLNRILEISAENMTVTAETGCTWAQIMKALAEYNLRSPHFGPSTGKYSTLGGSLSNNCMFFGSANKGTAADSVLGLEVVIANGSVIATGSAAIKGGTPFFRNHGPDLTGLFLNDCGALGIKTLTTLKLEPVPDGCDFLSFSYSMYEDMIDAVANVGRTGLASECLGVGSYPSLTHDTQTPTLHAVVEGFTTEESKVRADALRSLAGVKGIEVDPVIPRFVRENPFTFVANPLSPEGKRQIWTHGIVPYGRAKACYRKVTEFLDTKYDLLSANNINTTISSALAGTGFFLEPVFTWQDSPRDIHRLGMAPIDKILDPNPVATEIIGEVRQGLRDLFADIGAAHMQIGKFYAYSETLVTSTLSAVKGLKTALDPRGLMNPGALGL